MYYDRTDEAWATTNQMLEDARMCQRASVARAAANKESAPNGAAKPRLWWRGAAVLVRVFVS